MSVDVKEIAIRGYAPGVLGKIIGLHAEYYHKNWGFDVSFESQVARELGEFMGRFVDERDGLWTAWHGETFAGSVVLDAKEASTAGARLRWFIVAPEFHGLGVGARLIDRAVVFARQTNVPRAFLWTFRGLDAAKRLYERHGFHMTVEHELEQWGGTIHEQRFDWVPPSS